MAGALAEGLFAHKLESIGFLDVTIVERHSFSLDDALRYPLFTPDLVTLMRRLIPVDRQDEVAVGVTVTARKPGTEQVEA